MSHTGQGATRGRLEPDQGTYDGSRTLRPCLALTDLWEAQQLCPPGLPPGADLVSLPPPLGLAHSAGLKPDLPRGNPGPDVEPQEVKLRESHWVRGCCQIFTACVRH